MQVLPMSESHVTRIKLAFLALLSFLEHRKRQSSIRLLAFAPWHVLWFALIQVLVALNLPLGCCPAVAFKNNGLVDGEQVDCKKWPPLI